MHCVGLVLCWKHMQHLISQAHDICRSLCFLKIFLFTGSSEYRVINHSCCASVVFTIIKRSFFSEWHCKKAAINLWTNIPEAAIKTYQCQTYNGLLVHQRTWLYYCLSNKRKNNQILGMYAGNKFALQEEKKN